MSNKGRIHLFVGSMPVNKECVLISEIITRYHDTICENHDIPHYAVDKYNEGAKQMAAWIKRDIEDYYDKIIVVPGTQSGLGPVIAVLETECLRTGGMLVRSVS